MPPASERPPTPMIPELLAQAEHSLTQATFRLGRLRTRHRGSQLHRDLTALFYDIQAARNAVVAFVEASGHATKRVEGDDASGA